MELSEIIAAKQTVLLYRAMGTRLAEAGVEMGGQANLAHPELSLAKIRSGQI